MATNCDCTLYSTEEHRISSVAAPTCTHHPITLPKELGRQTASPRLGSEEN